MIILILTQSEMSSWILWKPMPFNCMQRHPRDFQRSKGFNFDHGATGKRTKYVSIKADCSLALVRYAACTWLTPFSPVTREYLFLRPIPSADSVRLYVAACSHYVVKGTATTWSIIQRYRAIRKRVNYSWISLTSLAFVGRDSSACPARTLRPIFDISKVTEHM